MFRLQKIKNWMHSSVIDDKKELNIYQSFQDQISLIDSKIEEYIEDLDNDDSRLLINYNGKNMSLRMLKILSESILKDTKLSVEQRAYERAELNRIYYTELKNLKEKIIVIAVTETDNVYLAYINSYIAIINTLLKQYAHLLAIQRSSIYSIDNQGELNAGEKLKALKDSIDIRTAEIQCRLTTDDLKR